MAHENMQKHADKEMRKNAANDSLLRLYSDENKRLRKIVVAQALKIFELGGYESQPEAGGCE